MRRDTAAAKPGSQSHHSAVDTAERDSRASSSHTTEVMDPTTQEIAAFAVIDDLATWAGISNVQMAGLGTPPQPPRASVRDTFYEFLGVDGTEHWRLVAAYNETDFTKLLETWKVHAVEPNIIQRAAAGLFGRAARVAAGGTVGTGCRCGCRSGTHSGSKYGGRTGIPNQVVAGHGTSFGSRNREAQPGSYRCMLCRV